MNAKETAFARFHSSANAKETAEAVFEQLYSKCRHGYQTPCRPDCDKCFIEAVAAALIVYANKKLEESAQAAAVSDDLPDTLGSPIAMRKHIAKKILALKEKP